jgi:hypothetical protein
MPKQLGESRFSYSPYFWGAREIKHIPRYIQGLALTCVTSKREHWHDKINGFLLPELRVSLCGFGRQRNGLTAGYANDTTILFRLGNHWNLIPK